jgi:hypothetical protein
MFGPDNGCHHAETVTWLRNGACLGSGITDDQKDDFYGGLQDVEISYFCKGNGNFQFLYTVVSLIFT